MMDNEDRVSGVVVEEKGDVGATENGGSVKELKVYRSKKKENLKREREVHSDGSESSEDLLIRRRKVIREEIEVDSKKIVNNGVSESEDGKQSSRLDVFEYDEYDEIDDIVLVKKSKKVRFQVDPDINGGLKAGSSIKSKKAELSRETECSREVIDKGKSVSVRQKELRRKKKKKYEMTKDGEFVALSVPTNISATESSNEMVQSEDDNVLKVMVKKEAGESKKSSELKREGTRKGLRSADTTKQESQQSPPPSPEKNQVKSQKSSSTTNLKVHDTMSKKTVVSSSLCSSHKKSTKLKKEIRNKGFRTLKSELSHSTRHGNKNVGDSRSTEQNRIRDQIRTILLDAGWKIEHRQRNNRDYQDSIYIRPNGGGGLWSIVKAYNAFITEWKNEGGESSKSFTPIPEELISQLTRQRRSKEERMADMAKKKAGKGSNISKKTGQKGSKKDKALCKPEQKKENALWKPESKKESALRKTELKKEKALRKTGKTQKSALASDANLQQGKKKRKQKRGALLVRSSNQKKNSDDGFTPFTGKRSVLSWLIDMGVVALNGKVQYMNRRGTRAMQEGQITRDGIHCDCCGKIVTVSEFEIHAGSNLQQPLQNIYVDSGVSLLQCQLDAWNKQEESDRTGFHLMEYDPNDPNDDTCGICADGGNLICCDGCPSTFHQRCLGIEMFPPGDWHCPNCICKVCKLVGRRRGQGDDTAVSVLLTCGLCEEKYHKSCGLDPDARPIKRNKSYISFCGVKCSKIYNQLQKLLGAKNELEEGFSWSLIRRTESDLDTSSRVLPQKAECNSKLAVALTVMNECFFPIVDQRTGISLIRNVVYNCGSNFNRVNYGGFYTVILERSDEIISAATIRIHGTRLAEMPFIGTRFNYRRQGMCRRLLSAIESALYSLNVERLVIPAIPELLHTWTEVFDFKPLDESQKEEKRSMNMLVFPGTGLLQKEILLQNLTKQKETDGSVVSAVVNAIGFRSTDQSMSEVNIKCDIDEVNDKCDIDSTEPDPSASDKGAVIDEHGLDDKVIAVVSGSTVNSDIDEVNNKCDSGSTEPDPSASDKDAIVDEHGLDGKVIGVVSGSTVNNKCDIGSIVEHDSSASDTVAVDNEHGMNDEIIGVVSGSTVNNKCDIGSIVEHDPSASDAVAVYNEHGMKDEIIGVISVSTVNNKCDIGSIVEHDPSASDTVAVDNEHGMNDEITGVVSGSVTCRDIACDTSDVSNKLGDSCLQEDCATDKEILNSSASVINNEHEIDDAVTDAVVVTLVPADLVCDTTDVASHISVASPGEVITSDSNVIDNADNFACKVCEAISGTLASGDSAFDTCALSNHLCSASVEEESAVDQPNIKENGHISCSPVKSKLQPSSEDASDLLC
ncbi:uncharacterized protein LOC113350089 isoform X1 [Papaver somniferum]|uniref:uncharacterized protein LOC113350089 isoform X1 n=1 Tax=Papaver somniferum TaxID=3469 RepID=UPI000E704BF4|nr:uncharacterized protein LOC113350089 isoform X1 [Papaver somniferum]XP_026449949.1 uncharacterized protein LOC113350089 isoform X1 [Papaver somniferum]XP_026449950.1 uncharacterized protein LOC113350089 isoform X1 [Papaver somniferum]XP_026449951.1 uncharacterized protein LOC113350089 isoform X1 [Papaver somniferum]